MFLSTPNVFNCWSIYERKAQFQTARHHSAPDRAWISCGLPQHSQTWPQQLITLASYVWDQLELQHPHAGNISVPFLVIHRILVSSMALVNTSIDTQSTQTHPKKLDLRGHG